MHTHYHPKTQTWFTLDTCENCGGDVQAANAVKLVNPNSRTLKYLGIISVDTLPVEGYYNEVRDGETCDNCDGDFDDEVLEKLKQSVKQEGYDPA